MTPVSSRQYRTIRHEARTHGIASVRPSELAALPAESRPGGFLVLPGLDTGCDPIAWEEEFGRAGAPPARRVAGSTTGATGRPPATPWVIPEPPHSGDELPNPCFRAAVQVSKKHKLAPHAGENNARHTLRRKPARFASRHTQGPSEIHGLTAHCRPMRRLRGPRLLSHCTCSTASVADVRCSWLQFLV